MPTTPDDPAVGFGEGLQALVETAGLSLEDVNLVLHGTTVVTNSLLQRSFEPTGLILTQGYRTLLEYARVNVPGAFGTWLFYDPPPRVVPLENVQEAVARMDRNGRVLAPLDCERLAESARWYERNDIRSVGVSLLWSFVNPAHEQEIKELFAAVYPDCQVVLSSEVLPELDEFERAITTALSAALRPPVGRYLQHIERFLSNASVKGRLLCINRAAASSERARQGTTPSSSASQAPLPACSAWPRHAERSDTPRRSHSTWGERQPTSRSSKTSRRSCRPTGESTSTRCGSP
ncbi:MAG: hypothetical protein OXG37_01435 [Actinomycetia bacterium]|nr:hypothetical protein [Actinomycetes bacterium]